MKKRVFLCLSLVILLLVVFLTWGLFAPATSFPDGKFVLYVRTGSQYSDVIDSIKRNSAIQHLFLFKWLANRIDYPSNVKAGKYEIRNGENLVSILRMLRNGKQTPVNLVITKLRTKEDLASLVGIHLECDSASVMHFLDSDDSLRRYNFDSNTVMTAIFPNTYTYFWNTTPSKIFKKFLGTYHDFWSDSRKQLADEKRLNPTTAYILASIIEEESNKQEDKTRIASVYLNRLDKKMKLAADPTVKFAMRNFELRRIYDKYLAFDSPYNTYLHEGLPPGPICTPAFQTLDAVLNAPKTNFLYFVAKPDFSGYSNFSESYDQHRKYAREYQHALDSEMNKSK